MAIELTGILLITAVVCGIIYIISYNIKRLHIYRVAAKFTGPSYLPILGSAHLFIGNTADILSITMKLMDKFPSPFKLWICTRLYIGLFDPDNMQTILQSPNAVEKDDTYKFLRPWLGTGLLTAPASKWKVHRKLLMPTFNQKLLESFVEVFDNHAKIMVQQLRKKLNRGEFDIFDYVARCNLDTLYETVMGVQFRTQLSTETRYADTVKRILEIILMRMFKVWLYPNFLFNLTSLAKNQRMYVTYLHSVANQVIENKRADALNNDTQEKKETAVEQGITRKAYLDVLMELSINGTKLTDQELREEVDTIIFAGSDTSSTIEHFTLMMLANFPEVQEKAYQELCDIYGDKVSADIGVKYDDLKRMEYLERVIKETMRFFPIGPVIARRLIGDVKLGDHTLPKGTSIVMGIIKLHRDMKHWPDPMKFDPDRFLPEEVAKRHPFCYLPFSGGPRNCIGQKYAMMAMKTRLATLLRRYVFIKDKCVKLEDIKLKFDFLLKPAEPLTVRIAERK